MLQGIEDHLEGLNHRELSQGKSQDESLRDENKLVECGLETMR